MSRELLQQALDALNDCDEQAGSYVGHTKLRGQIRAELAAAPPSPAAVPLKDDAFNAWVEEVSADHPNLLERQDFRNAMFNSWINGYNSCVDERTTPPAAVPLTKGVEALRAERDALRRDAEAYRSMGGRVRPPPSPSPQS